MTQSRLPQFNNAREDASEAIANASDDPMPHQAVRVLIANEQSTLSIDEERIEAAVRRVLKDSPYETATVSVAVVDDPTIHRLNREFLQHDYPTDVLSFVLEASESQLEGELVVSTDTALRNAKEYGWSAADELLLYSIHGALHLVGYRDKQPEECAEMHAEEARHLKELGIALPLDQSRWRQTSEPTRNPGEVPAS